MIQKGVLFCSGREAEGVRKQAPGLRLRLKKQETALGEEIGKGFAEGGSASPSRVCPGLTRSE